MVATVDKDELLKMQKEFHKLSKKHGHKNTISREDFGEALKIVGVRESGTYAVCVYVQTLGCMAHGDTCTGCVFMHLADKEILDRLFTLVDELGDNEINFKVWGQCLFSWPLALQLAHPGHVHVYRSSSLALHLSCVARW